MPHTEAVNVSQAQRKRYSCPAGRSTGRDGPTPSWSPMICLSAKRTIAGRQVPVFVFDPLAG
jgi:hypothetical protein